MILTRIANMIALVKSKIRPYRTTTVADSGAIRDEQMVQSFYAMNEKNQMPTVAFSWFGSAGSKFRTSTIYSYFSKLYSLYTTNDAVQATDLNQPYLSGNISPNERYAMLNPNGASRLVTIPPITYTSEAWFVSFGMNWNGSNNAIASILGKGSDTLSNIMIRNTANKFSFQNESGTTASTTATTHNLIGKNKLIHFVASGTALAIYVDAVLIETLTVNTNVVLSNLLKGSSTAGREFYGKNNYLNIRTGTPSQSQLSTEYALYRAINPEIPTVTIGTQEWATSNLDVVCTPMGNVINEITNDNNTEKIPTASCFFDTDGTPYYNVMFRCTKAYDATNKCMTLTSTAVNDNIVFGTSSVGYVVGKWHKISFDIKTSATGINKAGLSTSTWSNIIYEANPVLSGTYQTFTAYGILTNSAVYLVANQIPTNQVGSTYDIDNVSIAQVGWSGLTEVYNAVYAATVGTTTVKDTAGCLAASAWCHYNNDSANGAIYGKLYNWYAARTLQYDIDAYNAANPSTPWGYRVPTQADFTTLQTTLGGATVAGGKMKKEGLNYWTTPNSGANNASGFTMIPSGRRLYTNGTFTQINDACRMFSTTLQSTFAYGVVGIYNEETLSDDSTTNKQSGYSIRLIKS